jgi:hypothetical protein
MDGLLLPSPSRPQAHLAISENTPDHIIPSPLSHTLWPCPGSLENLKCGGICRVEKCTIYAALVELKKLSVILFVG